MTQLNISNIRLFLILISTNILFTCSQSGAGFDILPPVPEGVEAISLFGDVLYPPLLPEKVRMDREQKLYEAKLAFEASPNDADAIIWLGRRTAYLGRYREAIRIYTDGIAKHPDDPKMYRHRGHRYISIRQFDKAITDLEQAASLIRGTVDEIEPDGLPNVRNIPTSSLHSNIWYHLGLAYYLVGDFDSALKAYQECLKVSKNPDMLVATSHWLYMTLRRLEKKEEAEQVLKPIHADMDIIENHNYHKLLLMYKGEITEESILDFSGDDLENATIGYGIGNWHCYNMDKEEAEAIYRRILHGKQWAAFGYIAAEADLKNFFP